MFANSLRTCSRVLANASHLEQKIGQSFVSCYFSTKSIDVSDIKPIYKNGFISVGAAINKMKKLQVAATTVLVPGSFIANAASLCDMDLSIGIASVCLASTAAVGLIGQVFSHMIGFVYTSKDLQTVRVSYLDFWGGRHDIDFPREELMPLTDSAKYPTDFLYKKVYRYSADKPLKISFKSGEILNTDAFKYIFKYTPDS